MIDAPDWFVYLFDVLLLVSAVLGVLFLKAWLDAKDLGPTKTLPGKMAVDIREPTGFTDRHLVRPDPTGATVTVDNCVYMLTKPPSMDLHNQQDGENGEEDEEEVDPIKKAAQEHYPRLRFIHYPSKPFLGLPMFQATLRLEEYQKDNPEPIHPFYGRVDDKGRFIDSQLMVTGTEWQAQKSVIQATGIAMSVQERDAKEKEWQRAMANLPNKLIVYIGLGIAAGGSIICAFIIYSAW